MKKLLVVCGALAALLGVSNAEAYQNDCLASLTTPTWNEQQSVPCSVRLDGGFGMHFLDQLGGEHVDPTESLGYLRVAPAIPLATTAGTAITTNTTSAVFTLPSGAKTPLAKITAAGAQTQTFSIFGAYDNTAANGIALCTITLTVAVKDVKTCDTGSQITKDFPFYYFSTASTTGGASGELIFYNGLVAAGSSGGGGGDASAANQTTEITSLQLIDDIVGVEDAAETAGAGLARAGTVRRDTQASSAGTTGDNATLNTDALGNLWITGTAIEDAAETAGGQLLMAGSVRRDVAVTSAGASGENATINTDAIGQLWTRNVDPCSGIAKIYVPISQTTGTQLITGTASNRTYVCQLTLSTATTQNFALVSGTGSVCATSTGAMIGGTTAATGFIASANWAIVLGNGGATVAKSTVDANNICILMSSTGQLSGVISYVVAPN